MAAREEASPIADPVPELGIVSMLRPHRSSRQHDDHWVWVCSILLCIYILGTCVCLGGWAGGCVVGECLRTHWRHCSGGCAHVCRTALRKCDPRV